MNTTLIVASLFDCESVLSSIYADPMYWYLPFDPIRSDHIWGHTATGCKILQLLRDMYKFNVSYIHEDTESFVAKAINGSITPYLQNQTIDIYARPISIRTELLDYLYPLQPINTWRFGFLLRQPDTVIVLHTFYSKPFTRPAWNCLYGLALIFATVFYFLKRWERRILGGHESSFSYEILMVIGGYCQHIPPLEATLVSRRTAYFIFLIFAYLVYTFYTSNLLSTLVNENQHDMDLKGLAESDYECIIVDYMKTAIVGNFQGYNRNYSIMVNKLIRMPSMSVPAGMKAVKAGRAAILSDYTSLYPYIKRTFDNNEICELIQIDLFSNIMKYLYTSRNFAFKEQFKIGTLRAKETGILKRLVSLNIHVPECAESQLIQTGFIQISTPLMVLLSAYLVSVLILVVERVHYKRNKVWPYVE